ncbi:MAG TPA: hypothetical protein VJZ78_03905 [Anaerolineales bacterium]|nr:hypothetical protein [Anaerolineales bacterium]
MESIKQLKCKTCGAPLKFQADKSIAKCEYCGSEHISVNIDSVDSVRLHQLSPGLDRAASEMAIKRLKDELVELKSQADGRLQRVEEDKQKAINEIEKRKLNSQESIRKLRNELDSLMNEKEAITLEEKSRKGISGALKSLLGFTGGVITYLITFIVLLFGFSLVITIILSIVNSGADSEQIGETVGQFLSFFAPALLFALFLLFVGIGYYRRRKVKDNLYEKQRNIMASIQNCQESINQEQLNFKKFLDEQIPGEIMAIEKEYNSAKELIESEISTRQDQLKKHYKNVEI